ncbi:glycine--tRNA ligase [Candidatus Saccharibacteria bacterium]|nr:glycine--tRNA ligase [Candidatus Saccharibacteria bacterium]
MSSPKTPEHKLTLEEITSFAKRRGFVFQTSDIYGGLAGFWDLGPYGAELARNITASWWQWFVNRNFHIVGLDSSIIQHPNLWRASGHVDTFADPMIDCRECKHRFRADHVAGLDTNDLQKLEAALADKACPDCGKTGTFTKPRQFNMMFQTHIGPVEDSGSVAYLRPETAGGIFAQFDNVRETARLKLPFGIAQIGKAFRNEITPGDFIFRLRELTQMELELFVAPDEADKWFDFWKVNCLEWVKSIGLKAENLRWYEHADDERAHYAKASFDIQYNYPFGFKELYGIANRTDFDLKAHAAQSGKDLSYFDEATKTRFIPYVIEPSVGVERLLMAVLLDAYDEEEVNGEKRVVLRFTPEIAPIKIAVLPLSKKPELSELARDIFKSIAGKWRVEYDETQSIGRRYRRQDEIGTPYCVTIDFDSLEDKAVTIRERDTMKQERIAISQLADYFSQKLS